LEALRQISIVVMNILGVIILVCHMMNNDQFVTYIESELWRHITRKELEK